jgi:hypothetical protein
VRLRSCIAVELLSGLTVLSGLITGGWWVAGQVQAEFAHEAQAATTVVLAPPTRMAPPTPISPPTELNFVAEPTSMFLGVADDVLLAPLRDSPIKRVKFNRGGSSISLRIEFENGARAAFKPIQTNLQSIPRREVVAYRINRLMGLSSVPPAIGRSFEVSDILGRLHPESQYYRPRLQAEMIQSNGRVSGELSWWIPVIERGRVDGYEMDSMEGIVSWKRHLTVGAQVPKRDRALVAQISDMVLFDFIINNPDRWSGGNARVSEDQRVLYFMDNTMSFGDDMDGHTKSRVYLERCQKFSRSLVNRLRNLHRSEIEDVLDHDVEPFPYFLHEAEITALLSRRDYALEYIDGLIKEHGDSQVLAFP